MTALKDFDIEDMLADDNLVAGIQQDMADPFADAAVERDAKSKGEPVFLKTMGEYTAYAIDLDYLWRWEIYLEPDQLVQEGAAISLGSATEAVNHVLAYFAVRDSPRQRSAGKARRP
jgi:soluble methane monooxygenase-binding protein MmoD